MRSEQRSKQVKRDMILALARRLIVPLAGVLGGFVLATYPEFYVPFCTAVN